MDSIRVLVVDDSAFARKVMREVLGRAPGVEVVGIARDGLEALEKVAELRPDVVTLDLVMPELDGLGVLRALPAQGAPRVVVVSSSHADSELGVAALQAGAVDLVQKPTALATDRLYELERELVSKVRAAAAAHVPPAVVPAAPPVSLAALPGPVHTRVLVVGTSTGGPQALTRLLTALPRDLPAPVAVALHIPPGYTEALARRLDEASALRVVEAHDGLVLTPGMAVIAPGGMHLKLRRGGEDLVAWLDVEPLTEPHRPSVDVLFRSAAEAVGDAVLGVVLTGMGRDGLEGARAIRAAGGRVFTEAESSCVVYGMPRTVQEAGLSQRQVPIAGMAAALVEQLRAEVEGAPGVSP